MLPVCGPKPELEIPDEKQDRIEIEQYCKNRDGVST
jgi:hypothetical protein